MILLLTEVLNISMIKILHIFSGYGGGVSSVIWNLINNADKSVIVQSIMCFSMDGGEAMVKDVERHGGQVFIMPRKQTGGLFSVLEYLNNTIKREKFGIVHCHIDGAIAMMFRFFAIKAGIKHFIVHAHQSADRFGRQDSKRIRVFFRRIMTNIAAKERFTCGKQAGIYVFGKKGFKKAFILNNCLDRERYESVYNKRVDYKKVLCDELKIDNSVQLIGHVGRFDYPKNHSFLIQIAGLLKKETSNFAIVLVGDGALFDSIKDMANKEGLDKNTFFLGRRYDVPELMCAFDVVVLPSLSEGFPTVAIEAQAGGTHIYISDKVTRDADIGLGLVDFLPITDPVVWVKKLIENMPYNKADISNVVLEMEKKRYWSNLVGIDYTKKILQIVGEEGKHYGH